MRKTLLLLAIAYLSTNAATATIHTVSVSDFQFSPASVTAHVGDTIKWVWSSGTHTTTSGSKPAAAAAWDAPITSTATTFSYKLTVAGSYSYVCTPHAPMMAGTITVQSAAAVEQASAQTIFQLSPNPAANSLSIQLSDPQQQASFALTDVLGRTVLSGNSTPGKALNLSTSTLANGIYIVRAMVAGKVYAQRLEIAH
jgi:plastocyanin